MVSVIIPTYNRKNLIQYTLDSLKADNHPGVDLEVIVVDDHSSDSTLESIKEKYPWVVAITNTKKGAASARNCGLGIAKGQYIMYLDSDDLVGQNYFLKKIEYLNNNAAVDAVYGNSEFFESDTDFGKEKIIFKIKYPAYPSADHRFDHLDNYLRGQFLPQNALIWRKTFLEKTDGHDETLSVNQDVELFIRGLLHDMKIVAIEDGTSVYVRHHSLDQRVGVASGSEQKYRQILDLRKKILAEMRALEIADKKCLESMSLYLFYRWQEIRQLYPALASEFLALAKSTRWPIELPGGSVLKLLSKAFGPVNAVKIKELMNKLTSI